MRAFPMSSEVEKPVHIAGFAREKQTGLDFEAS
jgi:hypothetical protein